MKFQNRLLVILILMVFAMTNIDARNKPLSMLASLEQTASADLKENWWGYFDGDYTNISVIGLGNSVIPPVDYSCAIRIKAGSPELLGRRIKALKYSFVRLDHIENVSVWISEQLPLSPENADVYYIPVEKNTIKSFEKDDDVNILQFPEPYQVRNKDLYIGYSFTMTSNDGDPIVVSYANTMENAFFVNWGDGWIDNAGRNYGNLALMLLLDDGGEFTLGDVNYDMKINVADVSCAIDYIINGEGNLFNIKGADIDANGEINVVDVESIIDMILERSTTPSKVNTGREEVLTAESQDGGINVRLQSDNEYRGFQMDIVLPQGAEITDIAASDVMTHNLKYARVSDNRYRVIVTSLNGDVLRSEDILKISTTSDILKLENIVFATSELKTRRFANICHGGTASIENVTDGCESSIYSVYGMKVNKAVPEKGIYIINGKKKIIK